MLSRIRFASLGRYLSTAIPMEGSRTRMLSERFPLPYHTPLMENKHKGLEPMLNRQAFEKEKECQLVDSSLDDIPGLLVSYMVENKSSRLLPVFPAWTQKVQQASSYPWTVKSITQSLYGLKKLDLMYHTEALELAVALTKQLENLMSQQMAGPGRFQTDDMHRLISSLRCTRLRSRLKSFERFQPAVDKVRYLLLVFSQVVAESEVKLNAHCIASVCHSLRCFRSDDPYVRNLLSVITTKLEESDSDVLQDMTIEEVGKLFYGLNGLSSTDKAVRQFISALVNKLYNVEISVAMVHEMQRFTVAQILFGIQGLSSEHKEVMELIRFLNEAFFSRINVPSLFTLSDSPTVESMDTSCFMMLRGLNNKYAHELEVRKLVSFITQFLSLAVDSSNRSRYRTVNGVQLDPSYYQIGSQTVAGIQAIMRLNPIWDQVGALMQLLVGLVRTMPPHVKITDLAYSQALRGLQSMPADYSLAQELTHALAEQRMAHANLQSASSSSSVSSSLSLNSSSSSSGTAARKKINGNPNHIPKISGPKTASGFASALFAVRRLPFDAGGDLGSCSTAKSLATCFAGAGPEVYFTSALQISQCMMALKNMPSQHPITLSLLRTFTPILRNSLNKNLSWNCLDVATVLEGMQAQTCLGDEREVDELLSVFASHLRDALALNHFEFDSDLNEDVERKRLLARRKNSDIDSQHSDMYNMLRGISKLSRLSSDSAGARALFDAVAAVLESAVDASATESSLDVIGKDPLCFFADEDVSMSSAMLVFRNLWSDHAEVKALLRSFTKLTNHLATQLRELEHQHSTDHGEDPDSSSQQYYLDSSDILRILRGLRCLNTNDKDVQEYFVALSSLMLAPSPFGSSNGSNRNNSPLNLDRCIEQLTVCANLHPTNPCVTKLLAAIARRSQPHEGTETPSNSLVNKVAIKTLVKNMTNRLLFATSSNASFPTV